MREFQRGAVRLHILHHAADAEVHGAWLTEELASHGYRISPGTLYPTLHRLEADGLLSSTQHVVDGRTRRVYRATAAAGARSRTTATPSPSWPARCSAGTADHPTASLPPVAY